MYFARWFLTLSAVVVLGAAACSSKAVINDVVPPPAPAWISNQPVQPLTVEDLRVSAAGAYHAVLLRLSRFPDSVVHSAENEPARVRLVLAGPAVGDDLPWERVVTADDLVNAVSIARTGGAVHVTLELHGDIPPSYTVYEQADWVMVRLGPSR